MRFPEPRRRIWVEDQGYNIVRANGVFSFENSPTEGVLPDGHPRTAAKDSTEGAKGSELG
jgi:hypothetical protein